MAAAATCTPSSTTCPASRANAGELARRLRLGTITPSDVHAILAEHDATQLAGVVGRATFLAEDRFPMPSRLSAGWFTRRHVHQRRARFVADELTRAVDTTTL